MCDLGSLGVEDDYPDQKSSLRIKKKEMLRTYDTTKRVQLQ
jgi:hypothetical protein